MYIEIYSQQLEETDFVTADIFIIKLLSNCFCDV